jgi:spoIIIJ-associated protein
MDPAELKLFVQKLLEALGVEVSDLSVSAGPRVVVEVTSPDSKRLIGPQGQHLRALNAVARRLAEQQFGEDAANFLIDVGGYHEEQLERVRQSARMLAQRARLFKHDVELPPQSAYERLVVHELFAQDPEIATESAGEGKFRHIVLKYRASQGSPIA